MPTHIVSPTSRPTYAQLRAALGRLLDEYAAVDTLLDSHMGEASNEEEAAQSRSNAAIPAISAIYLAAGAPADFAGQVDNQSKANPALWDNTQALQEGWDVFESEGVIEIQRIDVPDQDDLHYSEPKFDSDDTALRFVQKRAAQGSPYHQQALKMTQVDGLGVGEIEFHPDKARAELALTTDLLDAMLRAHLIDAHMNVVPRHREAPIPGPLLRQLRDFIDTRLAPGAYLFDIGWSAGGGTIEKIIQDIDLREATQNSNTGEILIGDALVATCRNVILIARKHCRQVLAQVSSNDALAAPATRPRVTP